MPGNDSFSVNAELNFMRSARHRNSFGWVQEQVQHRGAGMRWREDLDKIPCLQQPQCCASQHHWKLSDCPMHLGRSNVLVLEPLFFFFCIILNGWNCRGSQLYNCPLGKSLHRIPPWSFSSHWLCHHTLWLQCGMLIDHNTLEFAIKFPMFQSPPFHFLYTKQMDSDEKFSKFSENTQQQLFQSNYMLNTAGRKKSTVYILHNSQNYPIFVSLLGDFGDFTLQLIGI